MKNHFALIVFVAFLNVLSSSLAFGQEGASVAAHKEEKVFVYKPVKAEYFKIRYNGARLNVFPDELLQGVNTAASLLSNDELRHEYVLLLKLGETTNSEGQAVALVQPFCEKNGVWTQAGSPTCGYPPLGWVLNALLVPTTM